MSGRAAFALISRVTRPAVAGAVFVAGAGRTEGIAVALDAGVLGVRGRSGGTVVARQALLAVYTCRISLQ